MALISKIKNTADSVDYNIRDDVHTWGGRNLMKRTCYSAFAPDNFNNGTATGVSFADEKAIIPYGKEVYHKNYVDNVIGLIPSGTTLTCSIYIYEATAIGGNHKVYMSPLTNTTGTVSWTNTKSIPSGTVGLVSWQWTTPADYYGFVLDLDTRNDTAGQIIFGQAKVEIGNKATDWSPAPEDIAHINGTTLELLS